MVRGSKTGPGLITGPPLKERLPDVPQNRNPKVRQGVRKGGGMAGQAHVVAEGLETEVCRGARVVPTEQEARAGPAEQGV